MHAASNVLPQCTLNNNINFVIIQRRDDDMSVAT